jgi:hypothetical protein
LLAQIAQASYDYLPPTLVGGSGLLEVSLKKLIWLVSVILILLLTSACADRQLDNAFDGDFTADKNNKVITDYCQSCHIHKDFDPEPHIEKMRKKYRRVSFRKTRQCRSCHYIKRDWAYNTISQHTRFPARSAKRRANRK